MLIGADSILCLKLSSSNNGSISICVGTDNTGSATASTEIDNKTIIVIETNLFFFIFINPHRVFNNILGVFQKKNDMQN
jgi:hypothetical protein